MTKAEAMQILDEQKDGLHRYSEELIATALRCTGDLSGNLARPLEADEDQRVEGLGLGLRQEFEQERHIGAVRRSRSRTSYLV